MWKFALPRLVGGRPHAARPRGNTGILHATAFSSSARSRPFTTFLRPRHISFLFAMTTLAMVHQPHLITLAEAAAVLKPLERQEEPEYESIQKQECQVYGCPLLPRDIFFDTTVRSALEAIRPYTRRELLQSKDPKIRWALEVLESSGNLDTATLTLIGYKGGAISQQINQDRAVVLSPFRYDSRAAANPTTCSADEDESTASRLIGVFDGHATFGERVSQYVARELPKMLADHFSSDPDALASENVKKSLIETFIELDKTAPAEISGGCTASVVLQLGQKVYFANAGDSRSFLVVYHKQTKKSSIVYITREDKPHLPEERSRVESMGGQVYEPMRRDITSRVLYVDPQTGHQSGLAMSRSLGDWEAGKMGVIPDPLVEVIDIPELVRAKMNETAPNVMIDQNGHVQVESASMDSTTKEDDVHIFAVSASDGMMDYVDAATVASILSESLFEDEGQHLLSACESLVSMAAAGWQKARQGRYRDDIAIAVTKIRKPPRTASPEQ